MSRKPAAPRFTVDSMLGSLSRKLRMYGFDVSYDRDADDSRIIETALREDRVIITCDEVLHFSALKKGLRSILPRGEKDEERVAEVFKLLGLPYRTLVAEMSRCPACNGALKPVTKRTVKGLVPDSTLLRNKSFYVCLSCHKVYWQGGHWKRITAFDRQVESLMRQA